MTTYNLASTTVSKDVVYKFQGGALCSVDMVCLIGIQLTGVARNLDGGGPKWKNFVTLFW